MSILEDMLMVAGIAFAYAVVVNLLGKSLGKSKAFYVIRITALGAVAGLILGLVKTIV